MKTKALAASLTSFAKIAEGSRAEGLRCLANFLESGSDETIAARMKKLSTPPIEYPRILKDSLLAIQSGLKAAGASKQASAVDVVLTAFRGEGGDVSPIDFVHKLNEATQTKQKRSLTSKAPVEPNIKLARELADELAFATLNTAAFDKIINRLGNTKEVNGATLAAVANRFLGNEKKYTGRKAPLADIIKRQKADVRENARSNALSRVGV